MEAFLIASLQGCGGAMQAHSAGAVATGWGESRNVTIAELAQIEPADALDQVLESLNGRGNMEFAYRDQDGESVLCLSYAVCEEPGPLSASRLIVWAIFRDERFQKFVDWNPPLMEEYTINETIATRHKRLSIAEGLSRAKAAASAPSLGLDEIQLRFDRPRTRVEPSMGLASGYQPFARTIRQRILQSLPENTRLRKAFNGLRARIGSGVQSVEDYFGSPIRIWSDGEHSVRLYGSATEFELMPGLHFSSVVVAYQDAVVDVVYSHEFRYAILGTE